MVFNVMKALQFILDCINKQEVYCLFIVLSNEPAVALNCRLNEDQFAPTGGRHGLARLSVNQSDPEK